MVKAVLGVLILFGYIWCSGIFVNSQEDVIGKDVHDAEVRLKSDLLKNYSKDVLPPHNSMSPTVLHMGMSLTAIIDLDAKTQTLTSEACPRLVWKDSRLIWNVADYAGISVIRTPSHKVWQPDIQLYNSAKMREMDLKSEVFVLMYPEGTVVWIPPVTLYSICDVDLTYYPYDRHNCTFKFGSWTHSGDHFDIELYNDETNISLADVHNTFGEWEVVDTFAVKKATLYECCNETYPDVTFSVTLQRRSPFYRATILCPLVASVLLILASFWMPPASYHRMMLNVLAFLTNIAILMHLSSKLAAVGSNCPIVMKLCGVLLMISALTSAFSIIFMTIARFKKNEPTPEWVLKIVQSFIMKLLCITTPMYGHVQENGVDYSTNLVAEDDSKVLNCSASSKPNIWMMFFTFIDRLLFLICFIIISAVTISAFS